MHPCPSSQNMTLQAGTRPAGWNEAPQILRMLQTGWVSLHLLPLRSLSRPIYVTSDLDTVMLVRSSLRASDTMFKPSVCDVTSEGKLFQA